MPSCFALILELPQCQPGLIPAVQYAAFTKSRRLQAPNIRVCFTGRWSNTSATVRQQCNQQHRTDTVHYPKCSFNSAGSRTHGRSLDFPWTGAHHACHLPQWHGTTIAVRILSAQTGTPDLQHEHTRCVPALHGELEEVTHG